MYDSHKKKQFENKILDTTDTTKRNNKRPTGQLTPTRISNHESIKAKRTEENKAQASAHIVFSTITQNRIIDMMTEAEYIEIRKTSLDTVVRKNTVQIFA